MLICFRPLSFYFQLPVRDSPGQNQSRSHQQCREQERRSGQTPVTMRPDETCERHGEKPRPDHARDSDYAAVRALELPLLRWPDEARHQALRRRPEKPHEREDRQRAQKGAPSRRQAEDREPYAPAEKPRQKRPPLAEAQIG